MRGAFYSAAFPIWEGFDEWAHFAVVQRIAERGELLVSRFSPISREIDESLKLAPVPWQLHAFPAPAVTQDAFWQLSSEQRSSRERRFLAMPRSGARDDSTGGLPAYEALQGPLYYWIAAPVLRVTAGFDLGVRLIVLRCFSMLIASAVIPLCFHVGRIVLLTDSMGMACAALVAVMPEFLIDVARVANECSGVVCWSLLILLLLIAVRDGLDRRRALLIGVVLGVGLLTKAYFLAAIPAVVGLLLWIVWKRRGTPVNAAITLLCAGAISAWWYVHNIQTTGSVSGLSESLMLAPTISSIELIGNAAKINWTVAIDSVLLSHIWFGGWSSLTVRSWIYHIFYVVFAVAAIGLFRGVRTPLSIVLLGVYACFWAAQLYNVLLLYAAKRIATSMGWYMYAVIAAEVPLLILGLRSIATEGWRRYVLIIPICAFAALDVYTLYTVALPYYSGLITHKPNGSVAAIHFSDVTAVGIGEILSRLTAFKTGVLGIWTLALLWAGYLLSTLALVTIGVRCTWDDAG